MARLGIASIALLTALTGFGAAAGQSLGDAAREARRTREAGRAAGHGAGKTWTNDDLSKSFPEIRLLPGSHHNESLSQFEGTPPNVVEAMLRLAEVGPGDTVFDLGSGDGRIVILAAEKFGALGVGVELDARLAARSRRNVISKNLQDRVKILETSFLNVDVSPATVVTLYLTTEALAVLRPHLEKHLKPGTRVVAHRYSIEGWTPVESVKEGQAEIWLYIYTYTAP